MNATYDSLNRQLRKANKTKQKSSENGKNEYKVLRNKINHLKTALKKHVIKQIAQKSESDSKQMWKVLNTEVGRTNVHDRIPDLNVKGKLISDD